MSQLNILFIYPQIFEPYKQNWQCGKTGNPTKEQNSRKGLERTSGLSGLVAYYSDTTLHLISFIITVGSSFKARLCPEGCSRIRNFVSNLNFIYRKFISTWFCFNTLSSQSFCPLPVTCTRKCSNAMNKLTATD